MYTRVHVQFTSIDDTKKRSFLLEVLSNKENLFQLSAFSTGFSFFFGGGGVHEFYELFPLFCHLCCMCVYVKCWCWYTIEKIFANFEILFQVKIYLIKKRYKLIFTTSWFSFCARSFFFYHYKTLKFYVLCIGREKILYFPARKVLTMLLLSCSLYIQCYRYWYGYNPAYFKFRFNPWNFCSLIWHATSA